VQGKNLDRPDPRKRLWSLFSPSIQKAVKRFASEDSIQDEHKSNIINNLNSILHQRDFYQELDFSRTTLSDEVRSLLSQQEGLSDGNVQRLNRLLIESAYPHDIAKIQKKVILRQFQDKIRQLDSQPSWE
jgi:hypothetical protein